MLAAAAAVLSSSAVQPVQDPPPQPPPVDQPPPPPSPTSPEPPPGTPAVPEQAPSGPQPPKPAPADLPPGEDPEVPPALQRPPTAADLGGITLEELLDTVVWVASKRDERVSAAPASITAYSDEDIRGLGYYTLYDLANFTPGWSGTIMFGEKVLETRGQKAGSFNNNKHLVYVDGIPVSHARSYKAPIDEELPLHFVRNVEFLRGPASSLYGTSAFFGVINVVPQKLEQPGSHFNLRLGAGTRHYERRLSASAVQADSVGSFRLALGYYDKNASRAPVGRTLDPNNLFWDDQRSLFVNAAYALKASPLKGTDVGVIYLRRNGGLGESWLEKNSSHRINDLTWETIIPYVKYHRSFSDRGAVDGYALYNTGRETGWWTPLFGPPLASSNGTGIPLNGYHTQVDDLQADLQLLVRVTQTTDLTLGVNADTRQQRGSSHSYSYGVSADPGPPLVEEEALSVASDRFTIYSGYLQLRQEVPFLAGLILTLGAREDVGVSPTPYQQLSPRAGVVQRLTDQLALKVFYGTALRAPGIKEIGLNQESRQTLERMGLSTAGVPELEAETLRSFEVGPVFSSTHLSASVTAFHNQTSSALDGTQYEGQNIFRNSEGDITAVGGEVHAQVAFSPDLRLLANYAWARARTERPGAMGTVTADVQDVPVYKANGAVIGRLRRALDTRAALVARWAGPYRVSEPIERPPGSLTLDANLVLGLERVIGADVHLPLSLELQVRNILDDRGKLPKNGLPDVPLTGRRLMVTLVYQR